MILVLGSGTDKVTPQLIRRLRRDGARYAFLDEDHPRRYQVYFEASQGRPVFRLIGGDCRGSEAVGSVFVRHAVARTLRPDHVRDVGNLQTSLNRMLLHAACPVINQPANAYSNYSKPYQLGLLAQAGFRIPRTIVTNIPNEARCFVEQCGGTVVFKGVSNVTTLAQLLSQENLSRIDLLPNSPTVFQEYVEGDDYRVHVVGEEVFVTRLVAPNVDYRRAALVEGDEIVAEAANLPSELLKRCVAFTKELGLIVSGIDFKEGPTGELVALELNPYPEFTFYGGRSGQPITEEVTNYLLERQRSDANVRA